MAQAERPSVSRAKPSGYRLVKFHRRAILQFHALPADAFGVPAPEQRPTHPLDVIVELDARVRSAAVVMPGRGDTQRPTAFGAPQRMGHGLDGPFRFKPCLQVAPVDSHRAPTLTEPKRAQLT